MRSHIAIKFHSFLEHYVPERRVFLRSDSDTRFIRLKSETQLIAYVGVTCFVAWTIIATAILLMDSIGSGNFREQAKRDQGTYEQRLNSLEAERNARAAEAAAAQERFNTALEQISAMQSEILTSEVRRKELETGIDVIQSTLRRTIRERDGAQALAQALESAGAGDTSVASLTKGATTGATTGDPIRVMLTAALEETARQRDQIELDAQQAFLDAEEMQTTIQLMRDENDAIFRQLEDALTISVEPLDKMFSAAGLNTEDMLDAVRRGYSGQGGPLVPLSFSTRGAELSVDALRANRVIDELDRLNIYRIAAQQAPFAMPVKGSFRFTSGFGMRWGRMHSGTDFAAKHGSPIYATADGIVTEAEWKGGYGRMVTIQHEFGIETRYAHLSRIRVREGQRVSRGDRIGDMGNTGRSTGTHLHYEIRVGKKAINPMIYIKAARNVF
ncbi:MAG: M23 family metallopeptidase [Pseudomonadota bacterium]